MGLLVLLVLPPYLACAVEDMSTDYQVLPVLLADDFYKPYPVHLGLCLHRNRINRSWRSPYFQGWLARKTFVPVKPDCPVKSNAIQLEIFI